VGSGAPIERVEGMCEEARLTSLDMGIVAATGSWGISVAPTALAEAVLNVGFLLGIDAADPVYGCETGSYGDSTDK
jgi:hypothetical protein